MLPEDFLGYATDNDGQEKICSINKYAPKVKLKIMPVYLSSKSGFLFCQALFVIR
ncbi:hypothetical protein GCM10010230_68490 [Streptomyces narbonensis]|nr:hypothetical protein GCM10010230_68490 [Streptomyces narbonensis]